ncbi:MAG: methyl-accepting chemotaxis protein [Deinococcales bacterium]
MQGILDWFAKQNFASKIMLITFGGLFPVLAIAFMLYTSNLVRALENDWGVWLQNYAYHLAARVEAQIAERRADTLQIANSIQLDQTLQGRTARLLENNKNIYSQITVVDQNGRVLALAAQDQSGEALETRTWVGQSLAKEPWFQAARTLAAGEVHQLEPDTDAVQQRLEPTPVLGMRFSTPLRNTEGQVVGVLSLLCLWSEVETIVDALVERGENEYSTINFVIVNRQGLVLQHPNKTFIRKQKILQSAAQTAHKSKTEGYVIGNNYDKITPDKGIEGWYRSDGSLGWLYFATESYKSLEQSVNTSALEVLWVCLAVLVVVVLVVLFATRYVSKGLIRLGQHATSLAQGKLEQDLGHYSRDELGRFAESFRAIIGYQTQMAKVASAISQGDLRQEVTPISSEDTLGKAFMDMTQNLTKLLEELQKGALALSSASVQVRSSSKQQTSSMSGQFAAIAQTTATVEEVQTTTAQALEYAIQTREAASAIRQVVELGVQATTSADQSMAEIKARVGDIAENILALSEQTQAIGEIIVTVSKLADQSNLLSLNAAIEAARAGEHGKGFSVVALEIRALAEGSKNATQRVRDLLSQIQSSTNSAVMTTEQGIKVAEAGVESIARVSEVIAQLNKAIENAAQNAQMISASVQQHSVGMNQIADAMSHLKQNAEATLHTAQQNQSAADELAALAERLKNLTDSYLLPQSHSDA